MRKVVTLTWGEWKRVRGLWGEARASHPRLSFSAFARSALLGARITVIHVEADPREVLGALNRIGSNINQIARSANSMGAMTVGQASELKALVDELRERVDALTRRLDVDGGA